MLQEEAPGMGLRRVLEEDPLLRTGAPSKQHNINMNNVAGIHI